VKIGTTPQGFFTLAHVPAARDLWLVCTGTGLGPFKSMLRAGDVFARFERVVLVHGTRTADQLGYRAELEALAAREPALVYLPMLTRDRGAALSGRIPAALGDGRLERAASCALDPAHSHLMLCGNPAMIGDAVDALAPRGLRKHRTRAPGHISAEKYW
jgi:ferredoxin--NADP+ reductase